MPAGDWTVGRKGGGIALARHRHGTISVGGWLVNRRHHLALGRWGERTRARLQRRYATFVGPFARWRQGSRTRKKDEGARTRATCLQWARIRRCGSAGSKRGSCKQMLENPLVGALVRRSWSRTTAPYRDLMRSHSCIVIASISVS